MNEEGGLSVLLQVILLIFFMVLIFFIIDQFYRAKKLKNYCTKLKRELAHQLEEQKEYNLSIAKTAASEMIDPLTGLANRNAFEDRLTQILHQSKRYQRSFGLMIFNVKTFAHINENYGYDVGDQVLIELSKRLEKNIRQVDTITRYAGDNFLFILPQLSSPETAAYVAQRLLDSLEKSFLINNQKISLTANIGLSIYPSDGETIKTLLTKAEHALNSSKKEGENKFQFFQAEMHALGKRELALSVCVREEDLLQKLILYYQPQVDTQNKRIIRIQVVPYLKHPELGLVSFQEFAKIAENNNKIVEVGEWALVQALSQFQKWNKMGMLPHQLAMYVTLRQIASGEFIEKVRHILEERHIEPSQILFEIYEDISSTARDAYSIDADRLKKAFDNLRKLGIETAISIVGIGHFALSKITQLPINHIKIDNKLILDIKDHPENENIINMILALSKNLHIGIIAEGIDHEAEKALLEKMGCEVMQGSLFAPPQTAEGFLKNNSVA